MKVSYKVVGASGDYTTLFDESSGGSILLGAWEPHFRPSNYKTPLFSSAAPHRQSLLNTAVSLPMTFDTEYESRDKALESIRILAVTLLTRKVHLKVEQGTETQYYPNALCDDYRPVLNGKAVKHAFTFETDTVTQTAPTT